MISPAGHLERERVLRRLVSGDDDPELLAALDRMRKNHYSLWLVLDELRASEDPGALIALWGEAPRGSQGWRKALFCGDAVEVLRVGGSLAVRLYPNRGERGGYGDRTGSTTA